jgi:hypothetical protein
MHLGHVQHHHSRQPRSKKLPMLNVPSQAHTSQVLSNGIRLVHDASQGFKASKLFKQRLVTSHKLQESMSQVTQTDIRHQVKTPLRSYCPASSFEAGGRQLIVTWCTNIQDFLAWCRAHEAQASSSQLQGDI